jgi:hypothetical protein
MIMGALFLMLFFCAGASPWLSDRCSLVSEDECRIMWWSFGAAIVGGVLLMEYWTYHSKQKNALGEITQEADNEHNSTLFWIIRLMWIPLSILLGAMPLLTQGMIALSISGAFTGLLFDMIIQILFGRTPKQVEAKRRQN